MTDSDHRSARAPTWALSPVAFGGISAVGFLGGALLYPLDYEEGGIWDDIFFAMLALGWIACLVTALVAYAIGRRTRNGLAMRMAGIALAWFVVVLVLESIHRAVG